MLTKYITDTVRKLLQDFMKTNSISNIEFEKVLKQVMGSNNLSESTDSYQEVPEQLKSSSNGD